MNVSETTQFQRRIVYGAALFLGVIAIVKLPPLMQVVGGAAAFIGAAGLLSEGFGYLRHLQAVRLAEQHEARRQEKKALRREREADLRTRRHAELQTQTYAENLRREAEAKALKERRRAQEVEEQHRYARERAIQLEAELLFALDAAEFADAVCAAFTGKNGTIESGNHEGERLCRRSNGTLEVLFLVSEKHEATREDVEILEAFRRDVNAEHGSLVSRSGFDADAVRLAANYPITLTDPYVLARLNSQQDS